jgi:AI-2E family transporter
VISVAPRRSMPHFLLFQDALNRVVGNYIRGQLTLATIIGVLAGVGCYFLGLSNFALIIGALAFLFETIPMLGPALASIPAILISLLLPDPFPRTYAIVVYFVIIQVFEGNVLGPRIVGHAVGLHPVVSILALIVGVQLFGAFGALIATPVLAAVWVVVASAYRSFRGESADQILANKRTSWIRRRSNQNQLKIRKGGSTGAKADAENTVVERPNGVSPSSADAMKQEKGISTPGKIEHIDLLRPIPRQEEKTSTGSGRYSEFGDEE